MEINVINLNIHLKIIIVNHQASEPCSGSKYKVMHPNMMDTNACYQGMTPFHLP